MGAKVRPAGYSGTPLPKKLGIKHGSRVGLIAAPDNFGATLGPLPADASLRDADAGPADVIVWFTDSDADLCRRMPTLAERIGPDRCPGLWVAWPKRSSGVATDLTEGVIRSQGLAHGLVDYKVCAIDHTWSGLKFARRRN